LKCISHGCVCTAIFVIAKPIAHHMYQNAGVSFSFVETEDIPRASKLTIVIETRPNKRMWPSAARECQKNRQSGASRFPMNHAAHTGPSHVNVISANGVKNFPSK